MVSNELEAFRAAHDCEEEEWDEELTEEDVIIYYCRSCGRLQSQ